MDSGHPFEMDTENILAYLAGKYCIPDDIRSDKCAAVAKALLEPHPAMRPSAKTLVAWLRELLWEGGSPLGGIAARDAALEAVLGALPEGSGGLRGRALLTVEQEMLLEAVCAAWPGDGAG